VTWIGVSTLLIDDGTTALMIDGFFTRPGVGRVLVGRIAPRPETVAQCLRRAGVTRLAAVICAHSHFDHALDAPTVCAQTGATLVGSQSTANIGLGQGLPASRILVPEPGRRLDFGAFGVTMIEGVHHPGDHYPGTVDAPLVPPARPRAWATGTCYSILVEHGLGEQRGSAVNAHGSGNSGGSGGSSNSGNGSLLIQATSNYLPGMLRVYRADVIYLGVGQLGKDTDEFRETYWKEVVLATGARRVVLVHWDDIFRPLDKPVRPMRYAMDDFSVTMRFLLERAEADDVEILIPAPWRTADPFAGLPSAPASAA
jgi:L-ascorbate metabolism protein UlaG (beta-lactamase superfamily)